MKILTLTHPSVRLARNHPAIKGRNLLGAGQFSAVFEGSRPDTVLKLTVDPAGYWLFNDDVVRCQGRHFPTTGEDYGQIDEVVVHANLTNGRPRQVPIYLYEQERLEKLSQKSDQRKLAKSIINLSRQASNDPIYIDTCAKRRHPRLRDVDDARLTLQVMGRSQELPESVREAIGNLESFCQHFDDLFLDLHFGNFMVRPSTGDLIFSDPFGCSSIFRGHKNFY